MMTTNNPETGAGSEGPSAQSTSSPRVSCPRSRFFCGSRDRPFASNEPGVEGGPGDDNRQHWFHWHHHHHHHSHPDHGHDRCHHRQGGPWGWGLRWHDGPGDRSRRCGGRNGASAAAAGARSTKQPLDDSRWLEDYFSWH